jgi:isopenicillin-N epimerase
LLDPDVVFLNHGSFGACPKPVFETYQRWQLELERQPVEFLGRRNDDLLNTARASLGKYLNANADDLIFVPNATTGINTVARSLALRAGDEVLTTDHEYGAMDYTWQFVCGKAGACYVRHSVPLPVESAEQFVESFWSAVTPRTRVIFLSHITSPTALIFPIAEIVRRARQAGILTVIDGAHVPGQLPLDLTALDADFYSGNCHKWLCAPKGSAFLHVRAEHHAMMEPLIISWGWLEGAPFWQRNQWQGTRDIAAFLTVPDAIAFQQAKNWDAVRRDCHTLACQARQRAADLFQLAPISPEDWFAQMVALPLPPCDPEVIKRRLYDEFRVEAPLTAYNGQNLIRVSFQGYNTPDDLNRLIEALRTLLAN